MKRTWLALAMILLAAPGAAQEYLEPDDAPNLTGHGLRLFGEQYGRDLKPVIGKDARVFAVIEGGLVPDFAVGLKTWKSGYRIFMLGERRGGGLDRCDAPIDNALALDIIIAWDKVLRQTRKRTGRSVGAPDVPFYHFGVRGLVTGRVLDTPPGSNPAQLGLIAGGLLQICSSQRVQPVPEALAEIRVALKAIH
jgi:hypothetical protein